MKVVGKVKEVAKVKAEVRAAECRSRPCLKQQSWNRLERYVYIYWKMWSGCQNQFQFLDSYVQEFQDQRVKDCLIFLTLFGHWP